MKKTLLAAALAASFAASAKAAITETTITQESSTGGTVEGTYITGSGSSSELSSDTYTFIKLAGTLNFDVDRTITLTASNAKVGSSVYSFWTSATSVVTFSNGGKLITASANNAGISIGAATTITVDATGGGIVTPKIAFLSTTVMNLNKENAIVRADGAGFQLTNVMGKTNGLTINMSANQRVGLDLRSTTIAVLNITNNALLKVDRVDSIFATGITAYFRITDGELDEGGILFSKSSTSWDINSFNQATGTFTYTYGGKTEYIVLQNASGTVLTDLNYVETASGYLLTGMAVPEPAEWAAIFGATALAFAFLRRRNG